ncbi:outer membrane protein assembly factor BamD [Marinobacterium jannaschii]|uniref:outer membrane protein assembly factor BamD n=1 Tax=Marinobacterium jannaschii TaxID=64970 RepID=UPI000685CEDB|nr:outer membrane protein assembly factor BamD [Marinobacterium jannaschii]
MRLTKIIAVAALSTLLAACSSNDRKELTDIPEPELYEQALSALEAENYVLATEKLELLEARYPFGRYSEQAQLELIYAYHKNNESSSARGAADRFIRLHPNHENIDYAYYMMGLTAFEQDRSFFVRFLPLDEHTRDPGAALDAFEAFNTLLRRYPDSQYAPDARQRMVALKNRLAKHEVHVARFYIQRGAYVAAANRGRYVVENYQETPSTPDALAAMVEAYGLLGQNDLAQSSLEVLKSNFPEYDYKPVKRPEKTLLDAATFELFRDDPES